VTRRVLAALLLLTLAGGRSSGQAPGGGPGAGAEQQARIDAVFSPFTGATPGCAVGVARGGAVLVERAYGLADLEHDVPNRPDTIFEAGSVAKQVVAAAVLLLARDGKLSLDDPLRKYIPELPEYGAPLTIRHALTHTSGLRDWGEIASLGGWPRGSRAHTQAHVLEIAARQRSLNFAPGTNWSYSNTGYNLAAMAVSRLSGQTFAEFCRQRLFEPRGMSHTSWRDDHTRVVKGRAVAYGDEKDGFHERMPFEDAHGNGGLLTTVGDLLRWNQRFDAPQPGEADDVRQQQAAATLSTGETIDYALGLFISRHRGALEIGHGGSTGGYRAYLARYPDQRLSVALLCNVSSADAEKRARAVADLFLPDARAAVPPAMPVASAFLDARAGLYRSTATGRPLRVVRDAEGLRIEGAERLLPGSASRFALAGGDRVLEFGEGSSAVLHLGNGLSERYERVEPAHPSGQALQELAGVYASEEAEVAYGVMVQKGELKLWRRPNVLFAARPAYADAFEVAGLGTVRFLRKQGRVAEMSIATDRVWDLRLARIE